MSRQQRESDSEYYEEGQMEERNRAARERELVLTSNEFAYVLDTTKGQIDIYVGPIKKDLAATDKLVVFNQQTKRFEHTTMGRAVQLFVTAPANWYVVLKNPARDGEHPNKGAYSQLSGGLHIGKKVNLHGPVSFAAWPGQMAKVIQGHTLKTNQYLVARIYDAAEANLKKHEVIGGVGGILAEEGSQELPNFENGQKLVIKGTDISFYMPPTGVEIIPEMVDNEMRYVREAVTLQRLEYCILISEDGEKHFLRGEDVVFPRPNQEFVSKDGARKFKAIELSEISGLYVKVIAPYVDEDGVAHTEGEELFITGKDKIYFPRKEHAIIKYGDHNIHYAVAIPRGEGRYVLDRNTGDVALVQGPRMFLPDPRREIITQRVLSDRECSLMYPGNSEVLAHNRTLHSAAKAVSGGMPDNMAEALSSVHYSAASKKSLSRGVQIDDTNMDVAVAAAAAGEGWAGDEFSRQKEHTKPRTITLDNKFEGAVSIDIWSGFAMMLVDKSGGRRVIQGPKNGVLLAYDETVEALHLSRGKPKTTDDLLHTAFLKTRNNYVSDQIGVITSDMVMVQIQVKFLVDFTGDEPEKWFAVDNYVKLLTDRARSMIKAVARKTTIADLQRNVSEIVRDIVLGRQADGKRPGMVFEENSMGVRDVDVLHFKITTDKVAKMLFDTQTESVQAAIEVSQREAMLANQKRLEAIQRELESEQHTTMELRNKLANERQHLEHASKELSQQLEQKLDEERLAGDLERASRQAEVEEQRLAIERAHHLLDMTRQNDMQALKLKDLGARVSAVVEQARAFSPELTAALNRLGDTQLLSSMAENFGDLAAVEGKGLLEMAKKYLDFGTATRVLPSIAGGQDGEQQ